MLKQKSLLTFIVNITQSLIGFVSVYFVANYMGPEPLGVVSSSLAFVSLFAFFSDLGFGLSHYKKISESDDEGKCIGTFLTIKSILTPITALIIFIVFFLATYVFDKPIFEEKYFGVLIISILSFVIGDFTQVIQYTFAAKVEKAKESAILLSGKVGNAVTKIVVSIAGMGVIYLALSNLIGALIALLLGIYLFRDHKISKPDFKTFISYKQFAVPSLFIGVTAIVSQQLDKVAIEIFSTSIEVGYYTAGQSLIMIMSFVSTIFIGILLPTYSRLYSENKIEAIRDLAEKVERYISLLLMPLGFFLFFNSGLIQQAILGPKFFHSAGIMKFLILNAILLIISQPYTSQLMGMNRVKLASILSIFGLFLNFSFYMLLIPSEIFGISLFNLGGKGAAIAQLIASSVSVIMFRVYANKLSGSRQNFHIFSHLIIAVSCFGLIEELTHFLGFSNFITLVLNFILSSFSYIAIMAMVKELNKQDVLYYLEILNLKSLKKYIVNEFSN